MQLPVYTLTKNFPIWILFLPLLSCVLSPWCKWELNSLLPSVISAKCQVGQSQNTKQRQAGPSQCSVSGQGPKNLLLYLVLSPQNSCGLPRGKGVSVWSPLDRWYDHLYPETLALALKAPLLSNYYPSFSSFHGLSKEINNVYSQHKTVLHCDVFMDDLMYLGSHAPFILPHLSLLPSLVLFHFPDNPSAFTSHKIGREVDRQVGFLQNLDPWFSTWG